MHQFAMFLIPKSQNANVIVPAEIAKQRAIIEAQAEA
jgi:hypothetical protein